MPTRSIPCTPLRRAKPIAPRCSSGRNARSRGAARRIRRKPGDFPRRVASPRHRSKNTPSFSDSSPLSHGGEYARPSSSGDAGVIRRCAAAQGSRKKLRGVRPLGTPAARRDPRLLRDPARATAHARREAAFHHRAKRGRPAATSTRGIVHIGPNHRRRVAAAADRIEPRSSALVYRSGRPDPPRAADARARCQRVARRAACLCRE